MKPQFTDITINGLDYSAGSLKELADAKIQSEATPFWEISLYRFVLDWISDSAIVEVKTSGSTGKPKRIQLEKEKMIQSAKRTGSFLNLKPKTTALLSLPTDFIAGRMMVVRAFVLGLNLIPVAPKGNPLEFKNEDFYFAAMTPMQVLNVFKNDKGSIKLCRIKNLIIGGGEISKELAQKISKLRNNSWHSYGMTETITHVGLKKLNGSNQTGYFEALPGVTFEKDQRDCLVIHASYLSENSIITNDIVNLYSTSRFEYIGRFDNVINTGGLKFSPEDIEKKLEHYLDQKVLIVGLPDEILGQKIAAVIEGSKENIIDFQMVCKKARLSKFENPKEVYYLAEFPRTANGKINRKALLKLIRS